MTNKVFIIRDGTTSMRSKGRLPYIYLSISLTCLIALCYIYIGSKSSYGSHYHLYYTLLTHSNHQSFNCDIPTPDPYDPSIQSYISKPEPLKCKQFQSKLTYLDDTGVLHLNKSALPSVNTKCKYRCFDRQFGDDVTLKYDVWKTLEEKATPGCEFVEVSCHRDLIVKLPIYTIVHNQIIVNATRLKQVAVESENRYSVLLFVIDSISRSNLIRSLPKTLKVLQREMGSVLLNGYTKVGDNSFPNGIAMLTGKRTNTAGQISQLPDDMSKSFFDDWPIIWKDFHEKNYTTFYAEDYPDYNLFQYLSNGFRAKPVDHYFRPFWVHLWNTFLHRRSTHLCYGSQSKLSLQLNYARQFLMKYAKVTKWTFNWQTEIGHDWMNQVNMADDELAQFFKDVAPYLKNTFVFVLSDHGHRFDPIRGTVIGRIEERMPFMTFALPQKFKENHPEAVLNLEANTKVLTSTFDIYKTMRDIVDMSNIKNASNVTFYDPITSDFHRGMSLLRPIPLRNCERANIPEEFCICQQELPVNTSNQQVEEAADALISHVNDLLKPFSTKCAILTVAEIRNAELFLPNIRTILSSEESILFGGKQPYGFYVNFRIAIKVSPSAALLEGTLRFNVNNNQYKVIGDVNRINRYDNQSSCIKHQLLRKYCYCQ